MFELSYPEFLLLSIPAMIAYRRYGRAKGVTGWLRLTLLIVLLICVCGPQMNLGGYGVDVIAVVDRSRSMPAQSDDSILELLTNLERNRGYGDQVGVITFGLTPQFERAAQEGGELTAFTKEILPDGSDLEAAIEKALATQNVKRPTRILVFSDGQYSGASPLTSSRRAREMNVPIDYREFASPQTGDIAVESIELPRTLIPREPFQFSVWVYADRPETVQMTVQRGDVVVAKTERTLTIGRNRILFRDLIDQSGFFEYQVRLDVPNDPVSENNTGIGSVRVESGPKLLLLTNDGVAGNLGAALTAARIPFDVSTPGSHPLTQDALDGYRGVILENVPAGDLGRLKMERLAQFVEDLGGGLLLTGGQRSFGQGGYYNSPLDPILPVSMEMREEHRKTRVAIAIALDRSGSMMAPVKGNRVKMDLADLGTAECVRLLSPGDSVAIIAVDSSAHVVQELVDVEDPEVIARKALGIESEGGGIFVYEALVAAGNELLKADQMTKHIILFSDARDSEEPGNYQSLLKKYEEVGITVSVIGLGQPSDVDAGLLKDIAKLGKGNIMFTEDAEELPRLFTEDTMSVARNSFIEADPKTQPNGIPGAPLPQLRTIGELNVNAFPNVGGYNLSYLKPEAKAGVVSQDEYVAPWSAFWYRGLGRVGAITLEVDGKFSGGFTSWDQYENFIITHARWLLGSDQPQEAYLALEQDGQDAVARIELDPFRSDLSSLPPQLLLIPPGDERIEPIQVPLEWTGPHTLEARTRLNRVGTYRTIIKTSDRQFQKGPALSLPYSPEYAPRVGLPTGTQTLSQMAELSGGVKRTEILDVFEDPPRSPLRSSLIPWFLGLVLMLMLLEIAGRRLQLWESGSVSQKDEFGDPVWGRLVKRVQAGLGKTSGRPVVRTSEKVSASPSPPAPSQQPASSRPASVPVAKPVSTSAESEKNVADAFAKAKKRAQDRR